MESILEEVKKFDDVTLRQKLTECGIPVGPITTGTKSLFQRRLALRQFEQNTGTKFSEPDAAVNQGTNGQTSSERKPSDGDVRQTDVFYAVCLPEYTELDSSEATELVFSDKDLALKTAKKVKGSRFKMFKDEIEAKQFSKLTAESAFQSPKKLPKEDVQVSTESSPYKGPKPQEIFILRRAVEKGDIAGFKDVVWKNPRYLVSSGDTPVMFQEGPRYTAMHIAALKNKPEMCRVILDTLENPEFVNRLYCNSNNTEETQNSRINFLVDLYLNMPDKGNCESPLHMACKFGHDDVVEVLAAHPKTDKNLKNKWGDTPKDLICARTQKPPAALKQKIEDLLKGQYYVPLIRSEDNSVPPMVGQPWSPDVSKSPLDMPNVSWSPKDPNRSIKACAGPMSPDDASRFHKRWTTPPSVPLQAREYINTKRSDSEKGLERIGRMLAHDMNLPWKEYWEFLQDFVDISSNEGLAILDEYFSKRTWIMFIKDFKDKFGIVEPSADFEDISTPVAQRSVEKDLEKLPPPVFDLDRKLNEEDKQGDKRDGDDDKSAKYEIDNVIVSPVTGLSQNFAQLKLDDSWSDQATIDTTRNSEEVDADIPDDKDVKSTESKVEDKLTVNNNVIQTDTTFEEKNKDTEKPCTSGFEKDDSRGSEKDDNKGSEKDDSKGSKREYSKSSEKVDSKGAEKDDSKGSKRDDSKSSEKVDSKGAEKDDSKGSEKDNSKGCEKNATVDDTNKDKSDIAGSDNIGASRVESNDTTVDSGSLGSETSDDKKEKIPYKRLVSEGSESVSSYETAVEEEQDSSLSYASDSSDIAEMPGRVNLKDKNAFSKIKEYLCDREKATVSVLFSSNPIRLILRLIPVTGNDGMIVDIVSIPDLESNFKEMLLLENVVVSSCNGDISRLQDGEEVELGVEGGASEAEPGSVIHAYLTRSTRLPKFGYIHGPQPTREDLDVCRALSNCTITPDSHPNVFSWKLSMAKFVKDNNFKWQSPAKLMSSLKIQGSPHSLPSARRTSPGMMARGTSPVISYGSPLGLSSRPASRDRLDAGIRTRLFPLILE